MSLPLHNHPSRSATNINIPKQPAQAVGLISNADASGGLEGWCGV